MKNKKETRGGKRSFSGRKPDPNKMVNDTIRLPTEVKQGLTTKEKRNSLLLTFQNKIKNESKNN